MSSESNVLRLTATVHEAAADPEMWPRFLEQVARAIGADVMLFQRHELTFELLLPHLAQARATLERLHLLEAGQHILDTLSHGVVMVTASNRVAFCNAAAEEMLRSGDGLALAGDALVACNRQADAALRRAIHQAANPGESFGVARSVLVPRPSLRRSYHVNASPLRRALSPFAGTATIVAVVLITDPEQISMPPIAELRQTYGLTNKEAMLAIEIGAGHSVERAAARLRMRYETARTHLRRVFSKTQTSRQADLVGLLVRLSQSTPNVSGRKTGHDVERR